MKELKLTTEQSRELLHTVRDDLIFLRSLDYDTPSRSSVRIASSILRRLMYERMYIAGWIVAGMEGEPTVSATDLEAMIADVPNRYIHYAYAGGARTAGAHHNGYFLLVIPKAEHAKDVADATAKKVSRQFKPGQVREFSFDEFCSSPCVASGNGRVSRTELVWYVANKRGGVHWDNTRGEWSNPVDARNRLLDEDHLIVGPLPSPLYENLSIAAALGNAEDSQRLIDQIDSVAAEEEYDPNVIKFREGRTGKYTDLTFNKCD